MVLRERYVQFLKYVRVLQIFTIGTAYTPLLAKSYQEDDRATKYENVRSYLLEIASPPELVFFFCRTASGLVKYDVAIF